MLSSVTLGFTGLGESRPGSGIMLPGMLLLLLFSVGILLSKAEQGLFSPQIHAYERKRLIEIRGSVYPRAQSPYQAQESQSRGQTPWRGWWQRLGNGEQSPTLLSLPPHPLNRRNHLKLSTGLSFQGGPKAQVKRKPLGLGQHVEAGLAQRGPSLTGA